MESGSGAEDFKSNIVLQKQHVLDVWLYEVQQ